MNATAFKVPSYFANSSFSVSDDGSYLAQEVKRSVAHASKVVALENEVEQLIEEWHAGTAFMSSMTRMVDHPAYQRLVSLGWRAVPYLLKSLAAEPDHWGPALSAITGENPVQPGHAGRVDLIAMDWINWGERVGVI